MAQSVQEDRDALELTRDENLKLTQIGAKAIQMIDDTIVADGCWLFYYAFQTEDINFMAQVCNYTTVSNLIKLLGSYDVIVQYTSLKAVANMLTTESEIVIDRAIFENVLDKLLILAKEQPRDTNFITEICFCLSNIASGT